MTSILNLFIYFFLKRKREKKKKKLMACCEIDIPFIFIVQPAGHGVRTFAYLQVRVAWRWCVLHHYT
jgi:hypothetical protein